MNEAARQARNAYARKYRKEHPEAERRYRENYWTHKAQQAEQAKQQPDDDKENVNK